MTQDKAPDKQQAAPKDQQTNRSADEPRNEEPLTEAQAPANPVGDQGVQANYDPSGQIVQPGEPLHSTDPEEQAAFEEERRAAIRRSQMGESLPVEEEVDEAERTDEAKRADEAKRKDAKSRKDS